MKNTEIRALSTDDIKAKIKSEKNLNERLKFGHKIAPIENPSRIKLSRKLIARLSTELTKRLSAEQ